MTKFIEMEYYVVEKFSTVLVKMLDIIIIIIIIITYTIDNRQMMPK